MSIVGIGTMSNGSRDIDSINNSQHSGLNDTADSMPLRSHDTLQQMSHETQRRIEQRNMVKLSDGASAIIFTLFTLEGWSIAEKLNIPCIAISTFLASEFPMPVGFEEQLLDISPDLITALKSQDSQPLSQLVRMSDVRHWLWRVFLADMGSFRTDLLGLPSLPMFEEDVETDDYFVKLPWATKLLYTLDPCLLSELELNISGNVSFLGHFHMPLIKSTVVSSSEGFDQIFKRTSRTVFICFGSMDTFHSALVSERLVKKMIVSIEAGLKATSLEALWLVSNKHTTIYKLWGQLSARKLVERIHTVALSEIAWPQIPIDALKHCVGFVHHGGSGSVHRAVEAGTTMGILPFMFDQEAWCERAMMLGLGVKIEDDGLTSKSWAEVFGWFLGWNQEQRNELLSFQNKMKYDGLHFAVETVVREFGLEQWDNEENPQLRM
jgi:hypothetical protein